MVVRRSPRRAPEAPPSPATVTASGGDLSSIVDSPSDVSPDQISQLLDDLRDLTTSRGWTWLVQYATTEWGSKAVRARLQQAAANTPGLAQLGALTASTLGSALAVERLLNAPTELQTKLRVERARRAKIANR